MPIAVAPDSWRLACYVSIPHAACICWQLLTAKLGALGTAQGDLLSCTLELGVCSGIASCCAAAADAGSLAWQLLELPESACQTPLKTDYVQ
jgi:hypothetical protein